MQHLYREISDDAINEHLKAGALVVYLRPTVDDSFDAVLDHPDYSDQADTVVSFLTAVNPGAIDEAMLKGTRLSESPGSSALRALIALAGGDERT